MRTSNVKNWFVLDANFKTLGPLDDFVSLIWTERWREAGDFEIVLPASASSIIWMAIGNYITYEYEGITTDELGYSHMIIEDINVTTDVIDGDSFIVTGRSLQSIFERRIVWTQTNIKGSLQDGIKKLVDAAIIAPKDSKRKIENFKMVLSEDKAITDLKFDGTVQFTGDNLYEVIVDLCTEFEIGFQVVWNYKENRFEFMLIAGKDHTTNQVLNLNIIFSPQFENINNTNYYESIKGYRTVALVAGEGEGNDRKTETVSVANAPDGFERRELFVDARDISSRIESESEDGESQTMSNEEYKKLLAERGKEKLLTEAAMVKTFDGVTVDIRWHFGKDYFLGDIVELENKYGMHNKTRIIEHIISVNADGSKEEYPTFEVLNEGEIE